MTIRIKEGEQEKNRVGKKQRIIVTSMCTTLIKLVMSNTSILNDCLSKHDQRTVKETVISTAHHL